MASDSESTMARGRGLITTTEREHIAGKSGEEHDKYVAVSRVRARINDELTDEVELLEQHHPDLLDELREVVCESEGEN
jgi:hypothetical protein